MVKHVFKLITNQRKTNAWLLAELLVVSVCLWYVIDYSGMLLMMKNAPLGYHIDNTYRIELFERSPESEGYIPAEEKNTVIGDDVLTIINRVKQYPDIEAVSLSVAAQPYSNARGGAVFRQITYDDSTGINAQEYKVTPSFFNVFQTSPKEGTNVDLLSALTPQTIILSADAEKELFGNGVLAVGKSLILDDNGKIKRVAAICTPVRWREYVKSTPCYYTFLEEQEILTELHSGNLSVMQLCVRVKPEADFGFAERFTADMANQLLVGNLFLLDVRPTSIVRKSVVQGETSQFFINMVLLLFLAVNIFFGVSGTFGLRTQQRRSEFGLRVAIGSSKTKIQRLVIAEGLLLLTLAMIPAIIIALNIGFAELVNLEWIDFTFLRFLVGILITYVLMGIVIFASVWYPAYRTTQINPAEALHNE